MIILEREDYSRWNLLVILIAFNVFNLLYGPYLIEMASIHKNIYVIIPIFYLPIVAGKFPCGQVNSLLDLRPLSPRQKSANLQH
jgi:hypothetical protein